MMATGERDECVRAVVDLVHLLCSGDPANAVSVLIGSMVTVALKTKEPREVLAAIAGQLDVIQIQIGAVM